MLAGVNLLGRKKDNPPPETRRRRGERGQRNRCEGRGHHRAEGQAHAQARLVAPPWPDRARTDDHRGGQAQA